MSLVQSSYHNFKTERILILDGGLGTTLEDASPNKISQTPLWSAKPIDEDPEIIVRAHHAFLGAGANILSTSTYQCSYETFQQAGYTRDQAVANMLKSVHLAHEARAQYVSETEGTMGNSCKIALSLGPFGATLAPAQEFDGFYPPPYGPAAYSPFATNRNVFGGDEERELEQRSVEALASFHLQRLFIFAKDAETWSLIDWVAFETVPLLREITAIKRAVTSLYTNYPNLQRKPWWISAVFPDGKYPQHGATAEQVIRTFLGDLDTSGALAVPDGVGINCTGLEFIPQLLDEMTEYLDSHQVKPWLVLYPNGGDVYDPVSQTWKGRKINSALKGDLWATDLVEVVQRYRNRWGNLILGGCCRTGPKEIEALARKARLSEV